MPRLIAFSEDLECSVLCCDGFGEGKKFTLVKKHMLALFVIPFLISSTLLIFLYSPSVESSPLLKKICTSSQALPGECYRTAELAGDEGCRQRGQTFVSASPGGSAFQVHVITCRDDQGVERRLFGADAVSFCDILGHVPISANECALPFGQADVPSQLGEEQCLLSNPITPANGNKYQTVQLNSDSSRKSIPFNLYYNSLDEQTKGLELPFGTRWSHTFISKLSYSYVDIQAGVVLMRPDGKRRSYSYYLDSGLNQVLFLSENGATQSLRPLFDPLGPPPTGHINSEQIIGWELFSDHGLVEEFDSDGLLRRRQSSNGHIQNFVHNQAGQLLEVNDNRGNWFKIFYQQSPIFDSVQGFLNLHLIDHILDQENRKWSFEYDASELLTRINYPDDTFEIYHYEEVDFPSALTGVTDREGVRYATWTYDALGRANSSQHFNGADRFDFDYSSFPQVNVTNPIGKQTTYHFELVNGMFKLAQIEGHQSANCAAANKNYTYYPNGQVQTKTDWQGNTTSYQYNSRNLEISRTEAVGTPEARTITTEWHPTFNLRTKITEPGRETIFTYGAQGRLLSQASNALPLQ